MRRLTLLLCLMIASVAIHASGSQRFVEQSLDLHGKTYRYQVFVPDSWTAARAWPVVLFLHGSGESGSDNHSQLSQGLPPWLKDHGQDFRAVVVIPQAPNAGGWNGETEQMALKALDDSIKAWHGDRRRLYLTGLSMGGYGAWQIALRSSAAVSAIPTTAIRCTYKASPPIPPTRIPGLPRTSASCRCGSSTAPLTMWCHRKNRTACTLRCRRVATMSVTPSSPVSDTAPGRWLMPPPNCGHGCSRIGWRWLPRHAEASFPRPYLSRLLESRFLLTLHSTQPR